MFKRNDSRAFVLGILAALLACSSLGASSTLNFPRLSFDPATFTGVAIANPTGGEALVTLTAYGAEGQLLEVSPNPAQIMVPANQQVSLLTNEIFPGGTPDPSRVAWFQAVSETDGLTGFFLFVDNTVRELDGADLPLEAQNLVFNQVLVDTTHSTELNIINPGSAVVSLQVELVTDPTPITRNLTLAPKGAARLDAASFFGVGQVAPGAYVKATSDGTIAGFEFVRTATGDLLGLNAQSQTDQLLNLYFPQVAVLEPWRTELGLVNYSSQPVIVTLSIFKPEGVLFDSADLLNNPVTRSLAAGESLVLDVETLFGFAGSDPLEGWMQVEATVESINGFISYGIPGTGSVASVTASVEGERRAIFSHIATVNDLFTGVALLNSGQHLTNVRILAMTPSNQVLGSFETVLHPRQRISKLIDELIPAASGQDGGIIWVKSDLPIHLTSIFGNSGTLANIPPQQAPEGYLPDVSIPAFSIAPALAVM